MTVYLPSSFRGGKRRQGPNEGSGLGLFIVKNIIEGHGGQITFESEQGVGTTSTLTYRWLDKANPIKTYPTKIIKHDHI